MSMQTPKYAFVTSIACDVKARQYTSFNSFTCTFTHHHNSRHLNFSSSSKLARLRLRPLLLPNVRRYSKLNVRCSRSGGGSGGGSGGEAPVSERVLSILPYVIPLLDSLSFGKYVFSKVPVVAQLLLPPLLPLYSIYRGIPFLAFGVFLILYIFVVRNTNISRYIRFNTYQALFIDIALILPQLFQGINLSLPSTITETCTTAVFYAAVLAVAYSVVKNAQGKVPDEIPGISDSVYQQMGPF